MAPSNDRESDKLVIRPIDSRVRKAPATVERIEPPHKEDWITGEYHVMDDDSSEFDLGVSTSSIVLAGTPSMVTRRPIRPRGQLERSLRLAFIVSLFVCSVLFFWEAFDQSVIRLFFNKVPRWRAVTLRITSDPVRARVFVGKREIGWTPLSTVEHCRGRSVRVRLHAEGYANWAWDGLCPNEGALELHVELHQPQ